MSQLREFDQVRVARLVRTDRDFDGTRGVLRSPRVGDFGIIVHEYDPTAAGTLVAVESVDSNGDTVWLADFEPGELELIQRPGDAS